MRYHARRLARDTLSLAPVLAIACLIVLAAAPLSGAAADPLVVGDASSYRLGGHLEILRDTTRNKSFAEVSGESGSWTASVHDEPNPGFTTDAYWVRFQLESLSTRHVLLALDWPLVGVVDLYVIRPGGAVEHMASGGRIPFAERPLPHRYPLFPIVLEPGHTAWCYIRVMHVQTVFALTVWNEGGFFRRADHDEQVIFGLFMGLFLVVILFNTLFFAATRDWSYLYYVFFVLSYMVFEMTFRGLTGEYLWPRHAWIDIAVEAIAASLAITTGLFFSRKFLRTKTWAPAMHRSMGMVILSGVANTLFIAVPGLCTSDPAVTTGRFMAGLWKFAVELTNAYLLVAVMILIVNALLALRRGFRAARFYLAAWLLLLGGGGIFGLFDFGLLPSNPFTRNALSVGASLEMVLLFLAIIDRYLLLGRENEKSQRERLEAMEKRLYSDPLTDLPNRNRLNADLTPGKFLTILLVNIDRFRDVNDCFGQKAGDYVIRELGNRVGRAVADHHGAVYRLHADEFAVVINSAYDDAGLEDVGHSIVAACQDELYTWEKETVRISVSVGAAVTDCGHVEKAEMALSVARSKKALVSYRPNFEVARRYADNLRWLSVIRESIESRLEAMEVDASQAGLTGREHEIALLLSERFTMAEIADRLFISRRTVEKHAENIYVKLGIKRKQEVGEHLLGLLPQTPRPKT